MIHSITEKIFVGNTALECSMGWAIYKSINDKRSVRNYIRCNATSSFMHMFLVEYSILNVSIASSITLYSAQQLRSVSTITERIFVVIIALECSMGRAIYKQIINDKYLAQQYLEDNDPISNPIFQNLI